MADISPATAMAMTTVATMTSSNVKPSCFTVLAFTQPPLLSLNCLDVRNAGDGVDTHHPLNVPAIDQLHAQGGNGAAGIKEEGARRIGILRQEGQHLDDGDSFGHLQRAGKPRFG